MENTFSYLLEKIKSAPFRNDPFDFLYIENFLEPAHFLEIITSKFIDIGAGSFDELLVKLESMAWAKQQHPGTFGRFQDYKNWRSKATFDERLIQGFTERELCSGGGLAMRLKDNRNLLKELVDLFHSHEMMDVVREKFSLLEIPVSCDVGIQKYLHGYEISPHPDTREKALTWMLNLNPETLPTSECSFHTQFMRFKPEYAYIYEIWNSCKSLQRHWVPWDWCETIFSQSLNNSITLFSPSSYSLHAVKANYFDLEGQRTQLYGNYWYKAKIASHSNISYKDFDFNLVSDRNKQKSRSLGKRLASKLKKLVS